MQNLILKSNFFLLLGIIVFAVTPTIFAQQTTGEFDINMTSLPPNYKGDYSWEFDSKINKLKSEKNKDEFETTAQYEQRKAAMKPNGLIALQAYGSRFSGENLKLSYDADKAVLKATIVPTAYEDGRDRFRDVKNENAGKKICFTIASSDGSRLDRGTSLFYLAAVENLSSFNFQDNKLIIPFEAQEAKKTMDDIKLLLVGRPTDPLTSQVSQDYGELGSQHYFRYTHLKLEEIWLYNQATGKIYAKLKPNSK